MSAILTEIPEFIRGALLVLLGFFFAAAWDQYKTNRDIKIKDTAVMFSLKRELGSIKSQVTHNKSLLFPDSSSSFMDSPLVAMSLKEVWQFVSYNLPKSIARDQILLTTLMDIVISCEQFNAHIGTRETFRVTQKALSDYSIILKMYENIISKIIEDLAPLVDEAIGRIEETR